MNKSNQEKKPVEDKSQNSYKKNNDNSNKEKYPTYNIKDKSFKKPNNSVTLQDGAKSTKTSTSNSVNT
jgi:hypothetical protein